MGELCLIGDARRERVLAEVVGFRDGRTLLMPLGELTGIRPGDPVVGAGRALHAPVGDAVLGRVLDGLGKPIDGGEPLDAAGRYVERRPLDATPPSPLLRRADRPSGCRSACAPSTCSCPAAAASGSASSPAPASASRRCSA